MSKLNISPRVALVIIAALFILPLALAWLMYSGTIEYNPAKTRNLGMLVQPPVPLPLESPEFAGQGIGDHWIVLYVLPEPCGPACTDEVTGLRQVHRAAGRNQSRIRLLLYGNATAETERRLETIYPSFERVSAERGRLDESLRLIAAENSTSFESSAYLIDPLGNIMLFYAAGFDPNDLKKDLKRLLTWSKLDE